METDPQRQLSLKRTTGTNGDNAPVKSKKVKGSDMCKELQNYKFTYIPPKVLHNQGQAASFHIKILGGRAVSDHIKSAR